MRILPRMGRLNRFGNIELNPAAGILNYGQGIFEGMKAIRREDGRIVLFRPDQNTLRLQIGADRMCMPSPSVDQFVDAVKQTALANERWALKPLMRAKSRGFSDVLYFVYVNGKYVEEVSSCNVFLVKDNTICTPLSTRTILPGITRKSIIEVACDLGYEIFHVEERPITIDELLRADEVFGTGTAVVVAPAGSITYQGERIEYRTDEKSVCKRLLSTYMGFQNGLIEDKKGWIMEIN